mmetsp:Transcript_10601/g.43296  ORF Transcript_10601/g.43296 Transcript_10601/m.43296 type:complete len:454 (-) Transcript_10601:1354-2715(-)
MEGQPPVLQMEGLADRARPVLQRDQLLHVQALALLVGQLVDADAVDLHDRHAGQPRAGLGLHDAAHRVAELGQQRRRCVVDVDSRHHDGAACQLLAGRLHRRRLRAQRKKPALEAPQRAAGLQPLGSCGEGHAARFAQVQCELGGALVATLGLDLQAVQDDFLQPGRQLRADRPRWHRVDIEPPAQPAHRRGLAKGTLAGGQVVEHDAQREQVAARVIAHELDLLRAHIGPGAHRQRELLLQQIGQLLMAAQAEIDQHRGAIRAEHDVAGLDVEVNDMLAVQRRQRRGDAGANVGDLLDGQGRVVQPRAQRVARNALHHDEGLARPVAAGHEAGHMRPAELGHQHLLDLEADDGGGVFAALDARHLHQQLGAAVAAVRTADAPEVGHAALVQLLFEPEAVKHLPGLQGRGRHGRRRRRALRHHSPNSSRRARRSAIAGGSALVSRAAQAASTS